MNRNVVVLFALAIGCGFNSVRNPEEMDPPNNPSPGPTPADDTTPLFANGVVHQASPPPPPLSGGTLLASAKHPNLVFVANPVVGRVEIIDIDARTMAWSADVGVSSDPGRMVEDEQGLVHVVLRNAGTIATLDPVGQTVTMKPVCGAPRGIALSSGVLLVTCAAGEIVRVPLDGSAPTTSSLERDLRDIVIGGDGKIYVSQLKSASVLQLDGTGITARAQPARFYSGFDDFTAQVAWRTVAAADGIYELHQYHSNKVIHVDPFAVVPPPTNPPAYGSTQQIGPVAIQNINALVGAAVTRIVDGAPVATTIVPLSIDMAIRDGIIALASMRPELTADGAILVRSKNALGMAPTPGPAVAVAFTADGRLLVQTRDPATLSMSVTPLDQAKVALTSIPLSNSAPDTGYAIFHGTTRAGIACMSCHPEGGEDGHTWIFGGNEIGGALQYRRTQSLRGGIVATAPFHWNGDIADVPFLSHEIFTKRMGGDKVTAEQAAVLAHWLDSIPKLPAPSNLDPDAVSRGAQVFATAGCGSCHSGAHFTDNQNHAIGRGSALQAPTLIGVGARAPFMHDGCAPTLMVRLTNEACGGNTHGSTRDLAANERADLVTYLESL